MKTKKLFLIPLFFCLFISLFGNLFTVSAINRKDIISLSIMIDKAVGFDDLAVKLKDLNFHNFTFVIWYNEAWNYILYNVTRRDILKEYGVLIPRLEYMQTFNPSERKGYVDAEFEAFHTYIGYYPKGFMDYIPDTYTVQYAHEKYNISFVQGYCFDQSNIDQMSMRGGWQLPYYSDFNNLMKPSDNKGVVVFPHNIWDWSESFYDTFHANTHILSLIDYAFPFQESQAKTYWLKLIDNSITSMSPFGYVGVQWEWGWLTNLGYQNKVFEWFTTLLENPLYDFLTYENTTNWFNTTFETNPAYRVVFTSPFHDTKYEDKIEWYYDNLKRVARYNGKVVSYVDYTISFNDKYRTSKQVIDWYGGQGDWNCIDISLYDNIKIDALGGGELRFAGIGKGQTYAGDLANFGMVIPPLLYWYQDPKVFGLIILGLCLGVWMIWKS